MYVCLSPCFASLWVLPDLCWCSSLLIEICPSWPPALAVSCVGAPPPSSLQLSAVLSISPPHFLLPSCPQSTTDGLHVVCRSFCLLKEPYTSNLLPGLWYMYCTLSTCGTNLWKPNSTCTKDSALTSAVTMSKAPMHHHPGLQHFFTLYGSATQAVVVVTFSHHGAVLKRA